MSRWENAKQGINKSNDRLIRMIYAYMKGLERGEITNFLTQTDIEESDTIRIPVETVRLNKIK